MRQDNTIIDCTTKDSIKDIEGLKYMIRWLSKWQNKDDSKWTFKQLVMVLKQELKISQIALDKVLDYQLKHKDPVLGWDKLTKELVKKHKMIVDQE